MGSLKKKILFILIVIVVISGGIFGYIEYESYSKKIFLKTIELINYDNQNNTITIKITGKSLSDYQCKLENEFGSYAESASNNICELTLPINTDYKITLLNNDFQTNEKMLTNYINNDLDFEFSMDTIYLAPDEEYDLNFKSVFIDRNKANYNFEILDTNIVKIENNVIKALSKGETQIKSNHLDKEITIIVTDLYHKAKHETKKESLSCNQYSKEESELLDEILEFKANSAGYATRGAAVAVARFLTLEFDYRIPYFYENGRVSESGIRKADGEGRYYKKGLYLHEDKFKDITVSYKGPAIWGCPLTNLENDPAYGYYVGKPHANGLDCSGFVSWTLKNAGFDPGDNGAGENEEIDNQMTDLGAFTHLDYDLINSGKIKPGDLANFWGHIAMIIGIDDEGNFYVAESLQNYYGVVARKYTPKELINMFDDVVLMDEYYKEEGKYKNWI